MDVQMKFGKMHIGVDKSKDLDAPTDAWFWADATLMSEEEEPTLKRIHGVLYEKTARGVYEEFASGEVWWGWRSSGNYLIEIAASKKLALSCKIDKDLLIKLDSKEKAQQWFNDCITGLTNRLED